MKEKIKSKKKFDDDIDEVIIKNGKNKKKEKVNKKHSFRKAKNNEYTEE